MAHPDFNLLVILDVLLAECSVARAAKRLRLSPSAMSRALARLRLTTGDPLLVRAGRGLVPTPRAMALRSHVAQTVEDVEALLRPVENFNLKQLKQTFVLRNRDGFVENFGPALLARVGEVAPGVGLRFVQKLDRDSAPLRDGSVDLETGVVGSELGPELRTQLLFHDRLVGVVHNRHAFRKGKMTPARFASGQHILVSRRGRDRGAVDEALLRVGLQRDVATGVSTFSEALALARNSEFIACVPERYTGGLREGLYSFQLPFPVPDITISLLWHPRMDADPGHRWLRGCVREVCTGQAGP